MITYSTLTEVYETEVYVDTNDVTGAVNVAWNTLATSSAVVPAVTSTCSGGIRCSSARR